MLGDPQPVFIFVPSLFVIFFISTRNTHKVKSTLDSHTFTPQVTPAPFPVLHSSVNLSNKLMLNIMTNRPMVTIIKSVNPNQPNIIAVDPTPLLTLPFPRSWAIVLAATEAVCCHNTETSTKIEATKMRARATCETGRDGKGRTSASEPRSSTSSCQPGKVARRMKQINAKMMAMILCGEQRLVSYWKEEGAGSKNTRKVRTDIK